MYTDYCPPGMQLNCIQDRFHEFSLGARTPGPEAYMALGLLPPNKPALLHQKVHLFTEAVEQIHVFQRVPALPRPY